MACFFLLLAHLSMTVMPPIHLSWRGPCFELRHFIFYFLCSVLLREQQKRIKEHTDVPVVQTTAHSSAWNVCYVAQWWLIPCEECDSSRWRDYMEITSSAWKEINSTDTLTSVLSVVTWKGWPWLPFHFSTAAFFLSRYWELSAPIIDGFIMAGWRLVSAWRISIWPFEELL